MKNIYYATGNPAKIQDFVPTFAQAGFSLLALEQNYPVIEGSTDLLDNARLKALNNSKYYPQRTIFATDGGVQIPFLGENWNHVLTKRLSGRDRDATFTEKMRAETLLELMKEARTPAQREIYWEEATVLVRDHMVLFEAVINGGKGYLAQNIPENFDESGYWLAYLWLMPDSRNYMELTNEEKIASSTIKQTVMKYLKKNAAQL